MKQELTFFAIRAQQSAEHEVFSFAADARDILKFSTIDRIARNEEGQLSGFQRPQIAAHIQEIKDYLVKPDAILPNPIVIAFTDGVTVTPFDGNNVCRVSIDITNGPPGLVVDGQQRLTALSRVDEKSFQVFVSAMVCKDEMELRKQFVLINNTRPLPKSLIYELLPTVDGLPHRYQSRKLAAHLTARLNFEKKSSLCGQINHHTNPFGIISDTSIQRVIMNSLSDGMMREFMQGPDGEARCFDLISEYYKAVQKVFANEWRDHTPKTSRLIHGAGMVAIGYQMEVLALLDGARTWEQFALGLGCLSGRTSWTSGEWKFADEVRTWRSLQNIGRDITLLHNHLDSILRHDIRTRRSVLSVVAA
ncbi:DGQHR domain-containing protein DpdB [Massilia sp. CMS3.1]|uniref:DGQHR domain-containing protein DpdB n=1 Tax=Massilia sp. CMS3.1 TaxID=3373083 RepID=UPI003EE7EFA7